MLKSPRPPSPKLIAALSGLPQELLVGVSGGLDSIVLLHALVASGRKPTVLHFDHGWRKKSAEDAAWVKALAKSQALECVVGKIGKSTRLHRETAARDARYAFFAQAARRLKIPHLVLAHHADDQVETFLLQLFRGSGTGGFGMNVLSERGELILHRPWLSVWREEIRVYGRRHRLPFLEDPSNRDLIHRRNLLRLRILPYLKRQWSSQLPRLLWRAAEIARVENEWLSLLTAEIPHEAELSVAVLRTSPPALQRRLVRRWLQLHAISDIDFTDVEAVRGLALADRPAKVNLNRGKFARRRAGRIFLS